MKRDRHLRKNIISTDGKLQPEVEKVYNEYKGKYLGLDEVLKHFIKLSYYLPDIYNIKVRYKYFIPDITFQSYRTEGFVYRFSGYIYDESYGNSKDKELENLEFLVENYETFDAFSYSRSYIAVDEVNKYESSFDLCVQYVKAIMRNPKVALYLNMEEPDSPDLLFNEEVFHEPNVKTAIEYCNKYFYYKRKAQQYLDKANNDFIKKVHYIAEKYNNQIYKIGYKISNLNNKNFITIRTRAKLYYGNDENYNRFTKDIYHLFIDSNTKICEEFEQYKNSHKDFCNWWRYDINQPIVIIDEIDNCNCYYPYWSLSLRQYIFQKINHYYDEIIYPKRSNKK